MLVAPQQSDNSEFLKATPRAWKSLETAWNSESMFNVTLKSIDKASSWSGEMLMCVRDHLAQESLNSAVKY